MNKLRRYLLTTVVAISVTITPLPIHANSIDKIKEWIDESNKLDKLVQKDLFGFDVLKAIDNRDLDIDLSAIQKDLHFVTSKSLADNSLTLYLVNKIDGFIKFDDENTILKAKVVEDRLSYEFDETKEGEVKELLQKLSDKYSAQELKELIENAEDNETTIAKE